MGFLFMVMVMFMILVMIMVLVVITIIKNNSPVIGEQARVKRKSNLEDVSFGVHPVEVLNIAWWLQWWMVILIVMDFDIDDQTFA